MENYSSYEDFIVSSHVGKLINILSVMHGDFKKEYVRDEKGSFWELEFNGTKILVGVCAKKEENISKNIDEKDTLYYSRVVKSWKN